MILRKLLTSVCLAALGACVNDPAVEPAPVSRGPVEAPVSANVTADVDADATAVVATTAAAKPRPRPAGPALSFTELQSCATLLIDANRHGEKLQSSAIDLLAERQRLYEAQRALRQDYQALNGASKETNLDYAGREADLSKTRDSYDLKVGLYGASVRNFKKKKGQYRQDCAYRPYSGRDLAALADGERAEMQKGFLPFKLPRL